MEKLKAQFKPSEIVALTAFGAMMYATNLFNNILQVKLDDYLEPFRAVMVKK
jgi:alkylhydroperoxidase family enzyme